ncbi:MAG: putative transport system ATP-binding protein [Solirubrobacterales bacterium]|jgi:putative ABC transport system ATP-binding protein|nr:putative transport system ATP-binding protein [Solirubrobacterales bacterium]
MRASTIPVECESLYRFFHAGDEETLALQGVTLKVDRGEIVAITGPSGSGKSTLLACLAGLDEPDGGTVRVDGERLTRRTEEERSKLRAQSIGILYQSVNLVGHLDIDANLALARRLGAHGRRRVAGEKDLLERVGIADRAKARPSELSGGELARAGLAVALANDPAVLLCDEPTGELDEHSAQRVLELLHERAGEGGAVIVVTHNPLVAAEADRVISLRDGRVVER